MVRIGIIGLGWMGQLHAKYLQHIRGAKLVAVCDTNEQVLKEVANQFEVKAFKTYQQLIAASEVDAVYIVTPQKYHYAIMKDAIHAGKHILCEKPLALTREEIASLRRLAPQSKGKIIINFPERFVVSTQEAVQLIEEGVVGKIQMVRTNFRFSMKNHHETHGEWVFDRDQGGGLILESSVHLWDMVRWVTKDEVVKISAVEYAHPNKNFETSFAAIGYLEGGGIVIVDMSGWLPKDSATDKRMEIIGEHGSIYIDEFRNFLTLQSEKGIENNPGMVTTGMTHKDLMWHSTIEGGVKRLSQYFVDCIEQGVTPHPTLEDGARATEITWGILESLESGKMEEIQYE
jgi:predicted dehydrogenase